MATESFGSVGSGPESIINYVHAWRPLLSKKIKTCSYNSFKKDDVYF
jgi:hypothetical protein